MDEAKDGMLRSADAIVAAAWPQARRNAASQLRRSSVLRWSGAMAAVSAMACVPHLAAGIPVPWQELGVVGFLAAVAARHEPHERAHLRQPPAGHGA